VFSISRVRINQVNTKKWFGRFSPPAGFVDAHALITVKVVSGQKQVFSISRVRIKQVNTKKCQGFGRFSPPAGFVDAHALITVKVVSGQKQQKLVMTSLQPSPRIFRIFFRGHSKILAYIYCYQSSHLPLSLEEYAHLARVCGLGRQSATVKNFSSL